MGERLLTPRELNRALLARQLLLRRRRLPVARAIERVGALQAQWPPSPFVALWARLEGFARADLVRALERRRVVKATLMRSTLHHVSAADYLAYAGLLREVRLASLARRADRDGVEDDLDMLADRILALTSSSPRSRPDLLELLGLPKLRPDDPRPWTVWHLLAARLSLLHTPAASAWRHNTAGGAFVPARVWLGAEPAGGEEAAGHLVRRYLTAFGPASRTDVAQWTGVPLAALEPALGRRRLRRFRDESGRELLDLPRAPLPPAAVEAPVRFLPRWDSALLAHADRSRILPAERRSTVIARNGDVHSTFLVDGFVAGTWTVEDGRVVAEPFEPLPTRARRELEREAAALAALYAGSDRPRRRRTARTTAGPPAIQASTSGQRLPPARS